MLGSLWYFTAVAANSDRTGYNIKPAYYERWLEALCETVKKLDPKNNNAVQLAWQEVMKEPLALIASLY